MLTAECDLRSDSVIADVGSGTGILSELFLRHGQTVFGIEPNEEMRAAAERLLAGYSNFQSVAGNAEATTLAAASVDFVTAGQAFHWFDQQQTRWEFARILQPAGWTVLLWNERRLDSTPFLRAYEELLLEFGTDYEQVRHENIEKDIAPFFAPDEFKLETFKNLQQFDFAGLRGRLLSSSYTPPPTDPRHAPMLGRLREIFSQHQHNESVIVEYDTKVYYGHLRPSAD